MNLDDDDFDTVDELPPRPRQAIPAADRKLLELAARALGAVRVEDVDGEEWLRLHFEDGSVINGWNSLLFSGDAFELAVNLEIMEIAGAELFLSSNLAGDKVANMRRVVTTFAAEKIGSSVA